MNKSPVPPGITTTTPLRSWKSATEIEVPVPSVFVPKPKPNTNNQIGIVIQKHKQPSPPTASCSNLSNKMIRSQEEPMMVKKQANLGRINQVNKPAPTQNHQNQTICVNQRNYSILNIIGKGGTSQVCIFTTLIFEITFTYISIEIK